MIGVGIIVSLVYVAFGSPQGPNGPWFPFFGFWAFLWIFILFGALRWFLWPRWGYGWGYGRGYGWGGSPRTIVLERYARGEITKDQLDQMMRDLDQHTGRGV